MPSGTTYNERETLRQLRDGNARAFEAIYHRHKRVLAANILSLVKSEIQAEVPTDKATAEPRAVKLGDRV